MEFKSQLAQSACSTELILATNCPAGGDSGHGGVTLLSIGDLGCTDLNVDVTLRDGTELHFDDIKRVCIRLGGDCEAENLQELLQWAASELTAMFGRNKDKARQYLASLRSNAQ